MFNVFVCSGKSNSLSNLVQIVNNHIIINEFPMKAYASSSWTSLLNQIVMIRPQNGIFFLDWTTIADDGSLLKIEKIRQMFPLVKIVILDPPVVIAERSIQMHVEPFDFIHTEETSEIVKARLESDIRLGYQDYLKMSNTENSLSFRYCGQENVIPLSEILFLSTVSGTHKIRVHHDFGYQDYIGSLAFEASQHSILFQCHRQYLVNLNRVRSFHSTTNSLELSNHQTLPVATRKLLELKTRLETINHVSDNSFQVGC